MGTFFVGLVRDHVLGDQRRQGWTLVVCAARQMPATTLPMVTALKACCEGPERLESLEKASA